MLLTLITLTLTGTAQAAAPQPERIARISRQVFGARWRVAACVAHYESTDGAHVVNGSNRSPWQIDVDAHPWADARRLLTDWLYAARVAYRISNAGRDWTPWTTHSMCGV
jgi:hypothetical protein